MKKDIVFFDTEVGLDDKRIYDIGATRNGASFHSADLRGFCAFASGAKFVCGHNIVHHDLQYHPTNVDGKREGHTVYAQTREECEKLLETMIEEVRNRIKAEKEQRKNETETAS